MEKVIDKSLKQENYRIQKVRLKKAIEQQFYIEAIAIEYSIFEDRSTSALEHADIKTTGNKGNPLGLSRKLNRLETEKIFEPKKVRAIMTNELICSIKEWKIKRDELMHALLNLKTTAEQFKQAAEEGYELVKQFDNKVACLNRYFDKQKEVDK